MAKQQNNLFDGAETEPYYSKIARYKRRFMGFFVAIGALTALTTSVIFVNILAEGSWLNVIVPVSLLGLLTLLYPPTETWLYKPWQASAQQVERHFYDN